MSETQADPTSGTSNAFSDLPTKEEVGAKLKQARQARGLTQEQAADLLDIHPATYQKWETGERLATWPRLARAALILGSSPNELLSFDERLFVEKSIRGKLDNELLGQALKAVAELGRDYTLENQAGDGKDPSKLSDDLFWKVMGSAFANIITLTLSGASAQEAVMYLQGVDQGLRNPQNLVTIE